MNCGFCGKPFEENRSQPACRQCPVGSGCGLVRCPHCGYENPGTPGWIAFLTKLLKGEPQDAAATASPPGMDEDSLAVASAGRALPMLRPRP